MAKPIRPPVAQAQWLTIPEAAAELRIGQSHLRRLIDAGEIPARRFGRLIRVPRVAIEPQPSTTR
jgi:excisionase family DNA binding protein